MSVPDEEQKLNNKQTEEKETAEAAEEVVEKGVEESKEEIEGEIEESAKEVAEDTEEPTEVKPIEEKTELEKSYEVEPHKVISPPITKQFIHQLLEKARAKIFAKREKKLAKILAFLEKQGTITNDQVEKLVKVSDATATRYMDILEKRGRVKQIDKGKYTFYQKTR